MRGAFAIVLALLTLAGGAGSSASAVNGTQKGASGRMYFFPVVKFEPGSDPTAHGDVLWDVWIGPRVSTLASTSWEFGVFTRDRLHYVHLRRAPAGRQGPIVTTFEFRPLPWETYETWEQTWRGNTGFSGGRAVLRRIALVMVRSPESFYLEAETTRSRHAARAQLKGPAKLCTSSWC